MWFLYFPYSFDLFSKPNPFNCLLLWLFFFPAENIHLFKPVHKLLPKNCPDLSSTKNNPTVKCQECPHLKLPQHNFNIRRREEESQCTWALLPVYWNLRVSTVKFYLLRVLNLYILLYTGVSYTKNFNHWNSSK